MKSNILFIAIFFLFTVGLKGQSALLLPGCSSVEVVDDLENYVTIKIDFKGEMFIEGKCIQVDDLRENLLRIFERKARFENLNIYKPRIELAIDKDIKYHQLLPLFKELRKNGMYWLFFKARSTNTKKLKKAEVITGISFYLEPFENANPIWKPIAELIRAEKERILPEGEVLPPPPYTGGYSNIGLATSRRWGYSIINIEVLENGGLKVDNDSVAYLQFETTLLSENSRFGTAYILDVHSNAMYKDWLNVISRIRNANYLLLDNACKRDVGIFFSEVDRAPPGISIVKQNLFRMACQRYTRDIYFKEVKK